MPITVPRTDLVGDVTPQAVATPGEYTDLPQSRAAEIRLNQAEGLNQATSKLGADLTEQQRRANIARDHEAAKLIAEQQKRNDQRDMDLAFRAETAMMADISEFKRGELNKLGQDATGAAERARLWARDNKQKYLDVATTPNSSRIFSRSFERTQADTVNSLGNHEVTQERKSAGESTQARLNGYVNRVLENPNATVQRTVRGADGVDVVTDVNIVDAMRPEIDKTLAAFARIQGMEADVEKDARDRTYSQMHAGALRALVDNGDTSASEAYFKRHRGEIQGEALGAMQALVAKGARLREGQLLVDDLEKRRVPPAEALNIIREKLTGTDRSVVIDEYNKRRTEAEKYIEQGQKDALEKGLSILFRTEDIRKVPPSLLDKMGNHEAQLHIQWRSILHMRRDEESAARTAANAGAGAAREAAQAANFITFMEAAREGPAMANALDLQRHVKDGTISGAQGVTLMRYRNGAEGELVRRRDQDVKRNMGRFEDVLGIPSGKAGDARRAQATSYINEQLVAFQKTTQRDMTTVEIDKLFSELSARGTLYDRGLLGGTNAVATTGYGAATAPSTQSGGSGSFVPEPQRVAIVAALRAAGIVPDNAAIQKRYSEQMQRAREQQGAR